MNKHLILMLAGAMLASSTTFASGFEKSIPFGGETSGVAGIGTPYMQGSQALFFNPAGLAGDKTGQDVSLNISPTMPTFKAQLNPPNGTQETASSKTLYPYGLMYGNTLNDKLGFGVGTYISGGSYADYKNIGGSALEAKADLTIMEIAAGVGYKVMDNLKVGATWRVVSVSGSLMNPAGANQLSYTGLKDTNYMGFKLGAQYKLSEKTELGFTYRGETNFKAKGTESFTGVPDADVKIGTSLPAAWTLGIADTCVENWKFFGEYVFTQYSKNTNLSYESSSLAQIGALQLKWKDQHNIRLAAEYKGMSMPIRFGYIWTSQVTNADYDLPTLTPPGSGNTVTLGTGQSFGNFRADGGFEYTMVSGTPTGSQGVAQNYTSKNELTEWALHLGGVYMF